MDNPTQELLKIKERVDKAEKEKERLIGQREQILKQLVEQFACPSLEVAQQYLEDLKRQSIALDNELQEGLATIKEELGW